MTSKTIQIAIHFPAGGVAKSVTTWALAGYLALKFKVLVIDLDSQASTSNALIDEIPAVTAYELLKQEADIDDAIVPTSAAYPEDLFLVSGSSKLSGLELETASNIERHYLLADALADLSGFDFILIDTPPHSGLNTVVSLTGQYVLPTITTDPKAWDQVATFGKLLCQVQRRINPQLEILGIVPTRYSRTILAQETLQALKEEFGSLVFDPIFSTVRLTETMAQGLPPWEQNKSNDYLKLTNNILRRLDYGEEIQIS